MCKTVWITEFYNPAKQQPNVTSTLQSRILQLIVDSENGHTASSLDSLFSDLSDRARIKNCLRVLSYRGFITWCGSARAGSWCATPKGGKSNVQS